ncbi:taste receptor type 2 member 9-like [Cyrtonyx montezumae]|uniref:taste receptor type 2 member 9-like n=1 Tax=Cyrtonyx montezumae TaxID=9017 RepID=UPI0032DA470E
MGEQHGHNATSPSSAFVAVFTLQALAGMCINAFIVAVSCTAWRRKKSLNSNEKILLSLGCFRFSYLCIIWVYIIISMLFPQHHLGMAIIYMFAIFPIFLYSSDIWTTACLYAFYCLKIANFRHHLFIYLKARVDRIVPWLLLSSMLLSLVICSPLFTAIDVGSSTRLNATFQGTFWEVNEEIRKDFNVVFLTSISGLSMAFIIVTISAFLLLFSLCRHKHKMQNSSTSSFSTEAHIKAMKSLLSFFFTYTMNYIALTSSLYYSSEKILTLVLLVLQYAFPIAHSLILICSSPRLERIALRILPFATCKGCTGRRCPPKH